MCKIFKRSRSKEPKLRGSSSSTCASSTCSLKGEIGKGSKVSGGWTEKSIGASGATTEGSGAATEGSRAATEGICTSSGKRSKTEKEDREARK